MEANRLAVESRLNRINNGEGVFHRRRNITADPAESVSALMAPKGAGDFLLDFDRPNIPFRLIVVKRDVEIVHEGQDSPAVRLETIQQVFRLALFWPPPFAGRALSKRRRVFGVAFLVF